MDRSGTHRTEETSRKSISFRAATGSFGRSDIVDARVRLGLLALVLPNLAWSQRT